MNQTKPDGEGVARFRLTVNRGCGFVVALAGGLFLLAGLYFVLQARLPALGAAIIPNMPETWHVDGVRVLVLHDGGAMASGDVALAVEGRPLAEWGPLVALGRSDLRLAQVDSLHVTVRRGGEILTLQQPLGDYPQAAALAQTWGMVVSALVTFGVGAFVLWQRPNMQAAQVVFLFGAALLGAMTWAQGLDLAHMLLSPVAWLYSATAYAAFLTFGTSALHLSLVFPSPHPALRGREWWAWGVHGIGLAATLLIALFYGAQGSQSAWFSAHLRAVDLIAPICGGLMIFNFVWGYRRYYDADARQRARLFLFTSIACGGLALLSWNVATVLLGQPLLSTNIVGLLLVPMPLAMAVAIVRHRLFDIDVIIRRTLIYTLLTAALALTYAGSVVLLQLVLGGAEGELSNLVIALSTLAIATLFSPLRRWIQAAIDRRFYRSKYDARATVARFAETAQSEVDLNAINGELSQLIQQTVQPSFVSVWLVDESRRDAGDGR